MLIKGKTKYLPKDVIKQIESIKIQEKITDDSEALKKMVDFSRIGLEVKNKMKKKNIIDDILEGLF